MTKILLVDHSGRGHAFADLFTRGDPDALVYYAPGCAAIAEPRIVSLPHLRLADPAPMAAFARDEAVDLAFVANANALGDGFVDAFRAAGVPTIGPDRAAARLEASKSYTKQLCRRHGIATAPFRIFDEAATARRYVTGHGAPVVVKADGLCGGNGSFVCDTAEEAVTAIDRLMVERIFDDAGARVVVEDRLDGAELLFFALVDGGGYQMLPMAVDYPHSDDGNQGVICGGMGAVSPHPHQTPELVAEFERQILRPLLAAVRAERLRFTGVLYVGTMLVGDVFRLLEVNVRMGEPEAEVVLPRLHGDVLGVCRAMLTDQLADAPPLDVDDVHLCNVVATQGRTRDIRNGRAKGWFKGWPYGRHGKHYPITGVSDVDRARCQVFLGQATLHQEKGLVTDGGRCLHVVGRGVGLAEAAYHAYEGIARVHFDGIRYRTDIGRVMPWDVPAVPAVSAVTRP
jgi:phosphoribosylamine--glycine ligase